jgi:hypothetical protein
LEGIALVGDPDFAIIDEAKTAWENMGIAPKIAMNHGENRGK